MVLSHAAQALLFKKKRAELEYLLDNDDLTLKQTHKYERDMLKLEHDVAEYAKSIADEVISDLVCVASGFPHLSDRLQEELMNSRL